MLPVSSKARAISQVGLGLVLHQADELIDTHGVPLDDLVAVALLLYFGIRTLQVRCHPNQPTHIRSAGAQHSSSRFKSQLYQRICR